MPFKTLIDRLSRRLPVDWKQPTEWTPKLTVIETPQPQRRRMGYGGLLRARPMGQQEDYTSVPFRMHERVDLAEDRPLYRKKTLIKV